MGSLTVELLKKKLEPESLPESLFSILYPETSFDLGNLALKDIKTVRQLGTNKHITESVFRSFRYFTYKPGLKKCPILGEYCKKQVWKYINMSYVSWAQGNFGKYKAIIPKDFSPIDYDEVTTLIFTGKPNVGYSDSYIGIGAFKTDKEADAAVKYIKTKTIRTLYSLFEDEETDKAMIWRHIPIQDFTQASDIHWDLSIPEIDQQLFAKYHLSESEIALIESL